VDRVTLTSKTRPTAISPDIVQKWTKAGLLDCGEYGCARYKELIDSLQLVPLLSSLGPRFTWLIKA